MDVEEYSSTNVNTNVNEQLTNKEEVELWLNKTDLSQCAHSISDDPLYNTFTIIQVLEEINQFDRDYIEGITQDLEPKHKYTLFLQDNYYFLYENKYLNQLLNSKSLMVRISVTSLIFKSCLSYNRENLSLPLLIDVYLDVNPDSPPKNFLEHMLSNNLDKSIGNPIAKTVHQKFSTADIKSLFSVVFLEDIDKKQDNSMELIQFLALNSLQNIEDIQNIPSLKSSYLKLLAYIFKYNTPETTTRRNSTMTRSETPPLFIINKYFGDSDTNDIGWKMFSQWTKSINIRSTPRKLMNAIGILNSFGPESTLVKNHIDVILVCLEKIFFDIKHEGICDMNTQCLNDIIKSNPNSVPLEMANRLIEFIFKSPGFLNNPRVVSEKGRPKNACIFYQALFQTLNQYVPGCGIKYALDISNLNGQIPNSFINDYFSGIDPEILKNHPNYEDFMKMFLVSKENYINSLIVHSNQDKLKSFLYVKNLYSDYVKIIKKLKTYPFFSISSIRTPIEKIMMRIFYSPHRAFLENKEFIIDSFSTDADDVDFLLRIIQLVLTNVDGKTYYHENNCNVINCIKLLMEINPIKTIPFIKNTIFSAIPDTKTRIHFAYDLYRLVDLDDQVVRLLNSVDDINAIPTFKTQVLILSLSSDILYQFYSEFLKKTISIQEEFIKFHSDLFKNSKLELYGHNRVELVKIFFKSFLQPSDDLIQRYSMKSFLDLFHYIEPNDPFIQEIKSRIIFFFQHNLKFTVLEMLVHIKSNKIKSLDCIIQELAPSLKINEKSLESKDINSVSTLTQLTIVRDIIKFYFSAKTIKISEILNLCHVSKLFLSVCQSLFRQVPFKPFRLPWTNGFSYTFEKVPSIKIQTTPFSLAHKGIYHMHYTNFKKVYHNKINEILYQLSSLSIKNPYILYEPTKDLNELVHLEIDTYTSQKVLNSVKEEITLFKRLPSLESFKLKLANYDKSYKYNFLKDIINQAFKYCPNMKQINVKITLHYEFDDYFLMLIRGFEMLKSQTANSAGSIKYNIHIFVDYQHNNSDILSKLLSFANKITKSSKGLSHFYLNRLDQKSIECVPYLKIILEDYEIYSQKLLFYRFFDIISPKIITFEMDAYKANNCHFLIKILESAHSVPKPPRELTFNFPKPNLYFVQNFETILKECGKYHIIDVFTIQHTDPTLTNTLELYDFSKYHSYKLISPISGRFEIQKDNLIK